TTVKVQEFLPDRSKVAARLSEEQADGWVSPNDLKLLVNVQNLFGTPAQHRRIDATLDLTSHIPSFRTYPDYQFNDAGKGSGARNEELGSQQSDESGNATFELNLSRFDAATYRANVL